MKAAQSTENPPSPAQSSNTVKLPLGLLGFEQVTNYALLADPVEKPFAWLKTIGEESLAFVVIDPFVVMPDYQPDIPQSDVEFLEIKDAADALLLGIVTIHGPNQATMNLKGPVVINRHTHIGKQVIITNATDYSVQHALPVTA